MKHTTLFRLSVAWLVILAVGCVYLLLLAL
jgi:hypothetical protein